MKEAHLKKIEARLNRARPLIDDEHRLVKLLQRIDPSPCQPPRKPIYETVSPI